MAALFAHLADAMVEKPATMTKAWMMTLGGTSAKGKKEIKV